MIRDLTSVSEDDIKGKNLGDLVEGMFLILLADRNVVDEDYVGPLRAAYLLYKEAIDKKGNEASNLKFSLKLHGVPEPKYGSSEQNR